MSESWQLIGKSARVHHTGKHLCTRVYSIAEVLRSRPSSWTSICQVSQAQPYIIWALRRLRRAQKVVETMVTDLGCALPPKFPTRAVAGAWLALRAEAGTLQELRRKVRPGARSRWVCDGVSSAHT